MRTTPPNDEVTRAASDAVAEFTMLAFRPDALLWDASTNAALAAYAWNAGDPAQGSALRVSAFTDPRMEALLDHLMEARRTKWRDCRFLVDELQARTRDGEIVLTFRLSWDGGETFRPCEVVVEVPAWGPELLN